MESYNSFLKYFFPILVFLQSFGCDSYRHLTRNSNDNDFVVKSVKYDCTNLKEYSYNGFYEPSENGKLFVKKVASYSVDSLKIAEVPLINFAELKSVKRGKDANGDINIEIVFSDRGAQIFKEYTANNIGAKVALIVKDKLITAPIIQSEISEGKVQISGNFNNAETYKIYAYLNKMIYCAKQN